MRVADSREIANRYGIEKLEAVLRYLEATAIERLGKSAIDCRFARATGCLRAG